MSEISPLLAARLNNVNQVNLNQNQSSQYAQSAANLKVDSTTKPDSVELSTKKSVDKKKLIKYGAIGVAFLGLAAGVATLIKRGQVPSEILSAQKSANKMEEEASALASEVQKMIDEEVKPLQESAQKLADEVKDHAEKIKNDVVELFNNGGKNKEGIQVAYITKLEDSSIMEELDSNGKLLRKSEFDLDGFIQSIEEQSDKGINKYKYAIALEKDGCISVLDKYFEDYKELPDGTIKANKAIRFKDGNIWKYEECSEELSNGTEKANKCIELEDGKPSVYLEGYELLPDGTLKINKDIYFEDGKPSTYTEGYEKLPDGIRKANKYIGFEDGKPSGYCEGYEELPDGTLKANKCIDFEDGKPSAYLEGYEGLSEYNYKAAKTLIKEGSKWVEKQE